MKDTEASNPPQWGMSKALCLEECVMLHLSNWRPAKATYQRVHQSQFTLEKNRISYGKRYWGSCTWKSTNATGVPYVPWIFSFKNPRHLIQKREWKLKHLSLVSLQFFRAGQSFFYLEKTWISSDSVQFGPILAMKSVGQGSAPLFCQKSKDE